jgi:hypothetical protein
MRRTVISLACAALSLTLWQPRALGAISASATLTSQPLGANAYEYSLDLHNTGSTNIGTFWFAWIPNYDFLPSAPTAVSAPAGWTGATVQDGFLGGYSIEWSATTPLAAGQTLSGFTFDTADAPEVINGISNFAGFPVRTSYVYIGASQTDPGSQFTATVVTPEPSTIALLALGCGILFTRRRRPIGK